MIKSLKLEKDANYNFSKGFAYFEFAKMEGVMEGLKNMHGTKLRKCLIFKKKSKRKKIGSI